MKLLTLFLFLSLSLTGVCQDSKTLQPLPKLEFSGFLHNFKTTSAEIPVSLKLDSLTLDEWRDPYLLGYGRMKEQPKLAMMQLHVSEEKGTSNNPWNMPVAKPGTGNWNMPVVVPDSTVFYYLKITGEETGNYGRKMLK
ncbi:hypothetical protein [Maribellus sp. YY47]|uniref:hypothetical protein n=1 Tax=Maribellus sp. YY47 TaxID=2929486 RepID=UPI002000F381|nr:hypothetical protein [Maribellus sp. YY47]MCK3683503.1 hypothetical protein [Maribellus sp. YY47]